MRRFAPARCAAVFFVVAAVFPALAQSPAPPGKPAEPKAAEPKPAELPIEIMPAPYTYEVAGRRDPFRSLLVRNAAEKDRARPAGLAGVMVEELELQGTIKTKAGWIAMMRASDNHSHLIRKGTVLFDGEVTDITANEVTFRQNVNDPTNPKPFREVVKALTLQKK
jgi:Tfp pilus assembly protein PilP